MGITLLTYLPVVGLVGCFNIFNAVAVQLEGTEEVIWINEIGGR